LPLKEFARETLWETVIFSGLAYAREALEEERSAICGERYAHLADRVAVRSGHVASSLTLGGRLLKFHRPRVRSADGEVRLPSWREWSSRDPLEKRAVEQMVLGVSTRRYRRSLDRCPQNFKFMASARVR
jgi:putative transposase